MHTGEAQSSFSPTKGGEPFALAAQLLCKEVPQSEMSEILTVLNYNIFIKEREY